eukprot:TRINITY_DN11382_c0_g1_i1.p1 TRINITY_DN11382_c0_g1~~TRINITY_DN11382_c0_g1_i1.p1  ORF type:complete len:638 (+),score=242.96 TRINITY_DN11382_c0_g1_i1:36-1916(+)
MSQKKSEVGKLFAELKDCEGNCKRTLQICDQILKLAPDDEDCVAYKIHTLTEFSRFNDCVKFIEEQKVAKAYSVQLAYAYYRLNKLQQAEQALKAGPMATEAEKHLLAQIMYKKEDFRKAAELYTEIKKGQDEEEEEVLVNLTASLICDNDIADAGRYLNIQDSDLTHDLLCNKASMFMAEHQWRRAEKCLEAAAADQREAAKEDGATEEQLKDYLATVNVQTAYIAAQRGETDRAEQILNEVLKTKPTSLSTFAVASNNICALQKEGASVFDAFKRLKPLREAQFDARLSKDQRLTIRYNTSLLLGHMGQKDQAKSIADSILKEDPNSPLGPLAQSVILCLENKYARAEDILRSFLAKHPEADAADVKLVLAQIHMKQGSVKSAVAQLKTIERLKHQLGVAATLVAAYEKHGDIDAAVSVLDEAIAHWKKSEEKKAPENVKVLLAASGDFKLKHKRYKEAAADFEEVIKLGDTDPKYHAGLVLCYARFDVAKAENLAHQQLDAALPPSDMTADQALAVLNFKVREQNQEATKSAALGLTEKKKKKKRPGKKPQNCDGEPDPDRWRAMRDRASYKALTKRVIREAKREKQERKNKMLRQAAFEREEKKEKLRVHYEAIRAAEKTDN